MLNSNRLLSIFVIVILLVTVYVPAVEASVVYGPEKFLRNTGAPGTVSSQFQVDDPHGNYTFYVRNGDINGGGDVTNGASSAIVGLNGKTIFSTKDFNQNAYLLKKNVTVQDLNDLQVEVRSKPGSYITMWMEDENPDIVIVSPWDDTVSDGTVTLKGYVTDHNVTSLTLKLGSTTTASIPVTDGNFTSDLLINGPVNISLSAVDSTGTLRTATLCLDGDRITEAMERQFGFDPLNPDSDSKLTAANEAGNGIPDGFETLGGQNLDNTRLPAFVKAKIGADPLNDDTDGDGLSDYFELIKLGLLTDVASADMDHDDVSDADEDLDNDGLTNLQEQYFGTDPLVADTDRDGLSDGFEVSNGSNPLLKDTDSDGLEDDSEIRIGTIITNSDTDGDGILDGDETYTSTMWNDTLGVKVGVTGKGDLARDLRISKESSPVFTGIPALVSPVVNIDLESTFDDASITMSYDTGNVSDPANLSLYYYDESLGTFVKVLSTVDPVNHTVTGVTNHFSLYTIFYVPTWNALFQSEMNMGRGSTDVMFVDVMFTIDSSGSMSWNDPYGYRKIAAKSFVGALLPGDRAGVVDFDSYASVVQPLTSNFNAVNTSIDRLDANGGTNIGAGVNRANNHLISSGNKSHAWMMILLTDGEGSYSNSYTQQAIANNITIYTIGLGSSVDTALLTQIATQTGGRYFSVSSADQLPQVFRSITEEIEPADTDGDGISDTLETTGYRDGKGNVYYTDPNKWDTDGDELYDGFEAGALTDDSGHTYFNFISNPMVKDSDNDGLWDDEELEIGTKPLFWDSDNDWLSDKDDPEPLTHQSITYVENDTATKRDFIVGAVFGETGDEGGAFHWLVGDMANSPYYLFGAILGGFIPLADLRDLIQSAANMDLVGSILNAVGFIPLGGDAVKITSTISVFMAKHAGDTKYIVDVVKVLSKCFLRYMPDNISRPIFNLLTGGASDRLGLDPATLNKLVDKGVEINNLGKYTDDLVNAGSDPAIVKEFIQRIASDNPETMLRAKLDKTLKVVKNSDDKIRWLEEGTIASGWVHILSKHKQEFNDAFGEMSDNQLRDLIFESIEKGKKYKTKDGKDGFEYYVQPSNEPMFVVVGSNGFIQTARPGPASNVIKV